MEGVRVRSWSRQVSSCEASTPGEDFAWYPGKESLLSSTKEERPLLLAQKIQENLGVPEQMIPYQASGSYFSVRALTCWVFKYIILLHQERNLFTRYNNDSIRLEI